MNNGTTEMEKFLDIITNHLLEKVLKETEQIKQKLNNLETKINAQDKAFNEFRQLVPVLKDLRNGFRAINDEEKSLQVPEIENVTINLSLLKNTQLNLDYIKSIVKYTLIEEQGPSHSPTFKIAVKVNGKIYYGIANSKAKARNNAAEEAFKSLIESQTPLASFLNKCHSDGGCILKTQKNDEKKAGKEAQKSKQVETFKTLQVPEVQNVTINPSLLKNTQQNLDYIKNIVKYTLVEEQGPSHSPTFKIAVKVNGKIYYGIANSKAKARNNAAEEVFRSLIKPETKPASFLNRWYPEAVYSCTEVKNGIQTEFKVIITIGEKQFVGTSSSKTVAKREAAERALSGLKIETLADVSGAKDYIFQNINGKVEKEAKKTKNAEEIKNITINPSSLKTTQLNLNYIKCILKYTQVEKQGPPHSPTFKVAVKVNGKTYYGIANSKKKAKNNAAEEVFKSLIKPKPKPALFLNKWHPNAVYTCTEFKNGTQTMFKITITIGNEQFVGTGTSKKIAKREAAQRALTGLQTTISREVCDVGDEHKANYIRQLVEAKFTTLLSQDLDHSNRKVLSGIVMTRGTLFDSEVISVCSGTKCIVGKNLSMDGSSLNDMHAEILSRRCLLSFFYDQLDLIAENKASIFTPIGKGYTLKEGIEFHLYINTTPCGDARVFSPAGTKPGKGRGMLRAKIEAGEGTHPTKNKAVAVQTFQRICDGERF